MTVTETMQAGERGDGIGRPKGDGWLASTGIGPAPTRRELPFDDAHAPLYSVGQVAGMLGVQPAFLRRLDNEEVIRPSRSEGGQRRYSQYEVLQVERVATFAQAGMNLAGIRHILELEARVRELEAELDAERDRARQAAGPETDPDRDG